MKKELTERLITYAKIDTQSDDENKTTPSTPGQMDLAKLLVGELYEIGMSDVTIDDNGYVMATLPSNTEKEVAEAPKSIKIVPISICLFVRNAFDDAKGENTIPSISIPD